MTEQITTWAILELMGHDRTAGRYSFENGLHRVDVPDGGGGFTTEMIGSSAIFRLRFVDEDAARLAARSIRPQPISPWELRKEMLRLTEPLTPGETLEGKRVGYGPEDYDDEDDDLSPDRMDDDEYDEL